MLQLIAHNDEHALFSSEQSTKLIQVGSFNLIGTLPVSCKIGYLQYGTCSAAFVNQTRVRIYDFKNQSDVYDFQSNLKICRIGLLKNILIVVSSHRILIHDIKAKSNKCYIPMVEGEHVFFSYDYYLLKIAYQIQPHLLQCREFWLNKMSKMEGVNYTLGAFSTDCQKIGLVLKNMISIYSQKKLLRLYGFEYNIVQLVPVGPYFFVKLEDGAIVGCGEDRQVGFLQWDQILVDFWDHEHQSVLVAGKEEIYEMGKGLVKNYRLEHAQDYSLIVAENKKKENQLEKQLNT